MFDKIFLFNKDINMDLQKKAPLQVSFYNFLETFVCQFKRLVNSKNK
jgi:hypothetical protein